MRLLRCVAKITTGSLYYHFKDKQDIYLQAVRRYYETPLNVLYPLPPSKLGIDEYWANKMHQLVNAHEYLRSYGIAANPCAISHFIGIETIRVLPEFRDIIKSYEHLNIRYWSTVLRHTPDARIDLGNTTYKTAGSVYQGIYLQLCAAYPNGNLKRPDISMK